jgi:hypothetical protein
VYAGAKSVVTVRGVRFKNGRNVQNGAGRRALTPPDPQLKGARYPGGFKPSPLNINPGFKTCR